MSKRKSYHKLATREEVFNWIQAGIFTVKDGKVFKGSKELKQRINLRRGMDDGDARVDLCYISRKRSCNVSHLVWMINADHIIPEGFEIHHLDEDRHNNTFENLICVHALDHFKFHRTAENNIPF